MKTEEEIKNKIKELDFVREKITGILGSEAIGAFKRALLWVIETEQEE